MILKSHKELNFFTSINTQKIYETSQVVSDLIGISVQPNKAIVGANAFAHSSGIHQDGMIKNRSTYEIINPTDVGVMNSSIVLTARSGRAALRFRLEQINRIFNREEINSIYPLFLKMADEKKEVNDTDLIILADKVSSSIQINKL